MTHFAVKRLASVEVVPGASNQHELNAGTLRTGLGFPHGTTKGALSILAYVEPDAGPITLDGSFTLYDAREGHPARSEYRMYYRLPGLVDIARPGDLLVLFRDSGSGDLHGALARTGTSMERRLEQLLAVGDHRAARRMIVAPSPALSQRDRRDWVQAILPLEDGGELLKVVRAHSLFVHAVREMTLPPTKQMAQAAREIATAVWGSHVDADRFIVGGLDAESALYFEIEREVGTRSLSSILTSGPAELDDILSWALRIQQSRKARRGYSLQNHLGFLLDREKIPYTPQLVTENGETPDFVVPGGKAYHEPTFPANRLRMVACKSTVRERWGQVLKEADRIPQKYLLTVDEDLTRDTLASMEGAGLVVFVPASIIQNAYRENVAAGKLLTVKRLIEELAAVL